MKKILRVIAMILCLGMLSGCGGEEPVKEASAPAAPMEAKPEPTPEPKPKDDFIEKYVDTT